MGMGSGAPQTVSLDYLSSKTSHACHIQHPRHLPPTEPQSGPDDLTSCVLHHVLCQFFFKEESNSVSLVITYQWGRHLPRPTLAAPDCIFDLILPPSGHHLNWQLVCQIKLFLHDFKWKWSRKNVSTWKPIIYYNSNTITFNIWLYVYLPVILSQILDVYLLESIFPERCLVLLCSPYKHEKTKPLLTPKQCIDLIGSTSCTCI